MQFRSSAVVVVGLIQVSVRPKKLGLWVSLRPDSATERRDWRIEWMLRVHRVKAEGPGLSLSPDRRTNKRRKRLQKRRKSDNNANK